MGITELSLKNVEDTISQVNPDFIFNVFLLKIITVNIKLIAVAICSILMTIYESVSVKVVTVE